MSSLCTVVQKVIEEKAISPEINRDDFQTAIGLLTQIASESFESQDEIVKFTKEHRYKFLEACESGFPFSILSAHHALKNSINSYETILTSFLMSDDEWLREDELNERFDTPFKRLNISKIQDTFTELTHAYLREGNLKAGYYLLWLIKRGAGCSFEIPDKDHFDLSSVKCVLSNYFEVSFPHRDPASFVEIFFFKEFRGVKSIFQQFVDESCHLVAHNYVTQQLKEIPCSRWPSKKMVIIALLEAQSRDNRKFIAEALISSLDPTTSTMGKSLLHALNANSLREALPHLEELENLFPCFNYTHSERIFGYPYIEFLSQSTNDPQFTRRLNNHAVSKVFVFGSLLIDLYKSNFGNPYLVGYDIENKKLSWGLSLSDSDYSISEHEECLSFHIPGEKRISLIDPKNGIFKTFELQEATDKNVNRLHFGSQGFAYQMAGRLLIGGKINDTVFEPKFSQQAPDGLFTPFSTHCGFLSLEEEGGLILVSPTGDRVSIECLVAKAQAQGNKLYAIEKNPLWKGTCKLTVRSLKTNSEVVSGIEQELCIHAKDPDIVKVCENGKLVLFSRNESVSSPIFIDLQKREVIYSAFQCKHYAMSFVDSDSSELWTWDQVSKKIFKVSPKGFTEMGTLNSGRGTTLLNVDKSENLYFIDIPY